MAFAKQKTNYFNIFETTQLEASKIIALLKGHSVGYIIRHYVVQSDLHEIIKNFWENSFVKKREDKVPAYNLGAFHYEKQLDTYFDEAETYKGHLKTLFKNTNDFHQDLMSKLEKILNQNGFNLRLAEHKKRLANEYVIRACTSMNDKVVIKHHEDGAQLYDPDQCSFEIQDIQDKPLIAVNICLENNIDGSLYIWEAQPDETVREHLNLQYVGYPYPQEYLDGYKKLVISIEAGDLYFFNAKHVHAVIANENNKNYRTTLSFFMGAKDSNTVIYWS